jgi:hypothetical protein
MLLQGFATGLQRYGVLLILTDGQITDMSDTMQAISRAAILPLRSRVMCSAPRVFPRHTV